MRCACGSEIQERHLQYGETRCVGCILSQSRAAQDSAEREHSVRIGRPISPRVVRRR